MLLKGRGDVCHMFLWSLHLFISVFVAPGGFVWMLLLRLISQLSRDSTCLITTMGFMRPICTLGSLHFHDHKTRKAAILCLRAGKERTHFLCRSFVCLEIQVSDVCFCTISVSSIRCWSGRSGWKTAASLLSWGQSPKFQTYPFFVFYWNMISMRPQQASVWKQRICLTVMHFSIVLMVV